MSLTIPLLLSLAAPPPALHPTMLAVQETVTVPDDLQERFVALEDEFDEARQAFYAKLRKDMEKHEEAGNALETFVFPDPIEPTFYPRFAALADEGSVPASAWCLSQHSHSGLRGETAKSDKVTRLEFVLDAKPGDDTLRGLAYFLMGESTANPPPGRAEGQLGREASFGYLDRIQAMAVSDDAKATTLYVRGAAIKRSITRPGRGVRTEADADADVWFRRAAEEYPNTETGRRCAGLLFAAERLQIGMVAPDIVGKDHDGNDIKRSDFAGKVTVLDFWGFW